MIDQLNAACKFLTDAGIKDPEVAIILGTGLGSRFIDEIQDPLVIPYKNIPHFPRATAAFHAGNLVFGKVMGKCVLAMQGRFHYYEGLTLQEVTFPVRVMKRLGVSCLLISNAAGNMNMAWEQGGLMLIDDHINLQPDNPLRGVNHAELGAEPFPDMSEPYARFLNNKLLRIAAQNDITLHQGVYVAVPGPNLETRAEYRYLRNIGADAVGMSTVPEVIVANHERLPCCAISVLTDNCDPDNLKVVKIEDIIAFAAKAEVPLTKLFVGLIAAL